MTDQLDMFESQVFFNTEQDLKICVSCEVNLPIHCFGNVGRFRMDGTAKLDNTCAECRRKHHRTVSELRKYIAPPDENYKCPVCLTTKEDRSKLMDNTMRGHSNSTWVLDHNHATGKFRGWLCNKCNSALGWLSDDVIILRRAVEYLEKHEEGS